MRSGKPVCLDKCSNMVFFQNKNCNQQMVRDFHYGDVHALSIWDQRMAHLNICGGSRNRGYRIVRDKSTTIRSVEHTAMSQYSGEHTGFEASKEGSKHR